MGPILNLIYKEADRETNAESNNVIPSVMAPWDSYLSEVFVSRGGSAVPTTALGESGRINHGNRFQNNTKEDEYVSLRIPTWRSVDRSTYPFGILFLRVQKWYLVFHLSSESKQGPTS